MHTDSFLASIINVFGFEVTFYSFTAFVCRHPFYHLFVELKPMKGLDFTVLRTYTQRKRSVANSLLRYLPYRLNFFKITWFYVTPKQYEHYSAVRINWILFKNWADALSNNLPSSSFGFQAQYYLRTEQCFLRYTE